jgi:CopG family transcriptional regulator, nickel-responsive regulator
MSDLERLSFSLEKSLCDRLGQLVRESGYENRSEYLRDLIRERLVERSWELDSEALGTVTLLYDHHRRNLGEKLTEIQHHHHDLVLATTHIHLDHDLCAEMIMARGRASDLRALAEALRRQKGVLHASLSLGSVGDAIR